VYIIAEIGMSAAETRFREVELILNKKLGDYRNDVASDGVVFRDLSAPTYHYKNQFLSWNWTFVRDTPRDGETKRVSISLGYWEPLDGKDKLNLTVRAEIFQQGQISRIARNEERSLAVEQIEPIPFAILLEDEFKRGRTLLEQKP
jgi:hypothetical protein